MSKPSLSEKLALYAAASGTKQDHGMAAEARALEVRVAELERGMDAWCKRAHQFRDSTDAANARAEAAEAKLARVRDALGKVHLRGNCASDSDYSKGFNDGKSAVALNLGFSDIIDGDGSDHAE